MKDLNYITLRSYIKQNMNIFTYYIFGGIPIPFTKLRLTPIFITSIGSFFFILIHALLFPGWWDNPLHSARAITAGYTLAAIFVFGGVTRNVADRKIIKIAKTWLADNIDHPNLDPDSIQIINDVLRRNIKNINDR
jgi:hypothetical protein